MEKRKPIKQLHFLCGILFFVPLCINKLIFSIAQKQDPVSQEDYKIFDWKYGKICYQEKGKGKPLLLVHSAVIGGSSQEWEHNVDFLAEYYHVYLIDLLGFGHSDKPKIVYTAYLFTALLNSFIEQVIQKPCAVIGSGLGASYAVMGCCLQPELYKKMLLISPNGISDPLAIQNDIHKRRILTLPVLGTFHYMLMTTKNRIRDRLGKELYFAKEKWGTKECIKKHYYAAHAGGENARFSAACLLSNLMNVHILEPLTKLHIPLYFIWGEENRQNPKENMEKIEMIKPRARYAVFEKTRGLPHYENASEFNKIAREFLH